MAGPTNPSLLISAGTGVIDASWTDNGDTYAIEVANNGQFSQSLFMTPSSPCIDATSEAVPVPAGTYYARIVATGGGITSTFAASPTSITIE